MFAIQVQITKFVDDYQPGWVECYFFDSSKKKQTFIGKTPYFTEELLDEKSVYPVEGTIACEIIARTNGIVKVNTGKPWGINSVNGETIFEVLEGQIIEGEHL